MTIRPPSPTTAVAALLLFAAASASAMRPDEPLRDVAPVPREVSRSVDAGRLDGDVWLSRAILVLPLRDAAGLSRLLAAQQDPASPDFRRWLTPDEFGNRFGASEADVAALRAHLEANGLEVEDVPGGRTALVFSGRAADVERAFATELHDVFVDGAVRVANVLPARLPLGLARRTAGLLSLNSFPRRRPLARRAPAYTDGGGGHSLAPADFATLYGIDALAAAGINGAGRKIAVIAQTNVALADTRFFRQYFGLAANDPQVVLNGDDPGVTGDEIEADLDIQWAGAVAPAAQVAPRGLQGHPGGVRRGPERPLRREQQPGGRPDPLLRRLRGRLRGQRHDVLHEHLGAGGRAGPDRVRRVRRQRSRGLRGQTATTGTIRSVNGLGSSPYATCVGGTQYLDTANPSAYWSSSNDPATKKSARGPIPEGTWNESASGSSLAATGGGVSVLFARPPWQAVAGIPPGTGRAVPDISVAGAGHTPYFIVMGGSGGSSGLTRVYGTSASAPAAAGIAALLSQRAGTRLGNLNPLLYALGMTQYGTSGAATAGAGPFRDVTSGTNSVPGVTGYDAGPGYDAATGLGSPDVAALSAALAAPAGPGTDFALAAVPAVASVAPGAALTVTASLAQAAIAADVVSTLTVSGLPAGLTASFSPSKADDATTGIVSRGETSVLTLAAARSTAAGTYRLDLAAAAGSVVRHVALFVTVGSQTATSPSGPAVQAPVVLDVFGAGGSHYTSDLVAVNRGTTDVTLLLRFAQTPAPSTAGPVVARSLGAGRQFYVPDVIAFLDANGYALPSDGTLKLGTLFATFVGAADPLAVYVGSRTSTPNPNTSVGGAFGTFSAAVAAGSATSGDAWIYGLRENTQFRSNLALVHAPGTAAGVSSGPVTLEVQIFDGDSGAPAGAPLSPVLQPGEFVQFNSVLQLKDTVLAELGITNGYARVRLTSGTDRFIAYGVVNDGAAGGGGTSDGSFIAANATEGLVPIVLDLPGATHYSSDLTLTNPTSSAVTATLTYTAAVVAPFSGLGSGTRTVTLAGAGSSSSSRTRSRSSGGSDSRFPRPETRAGPSSSRARRRSRARRTRTPTPASGGTFGLAYPAVSASARARRARPGCTASGRTRTRARTSRSRTRGRETRRASTTSWTSSTRTPARRRRSSRSASR